MAYFDEYAAERRAALSRAHLPARWRTWMEKWSMCRGQAWKIDQRWTAHQLFVHTETLKGVGEWAPLSVAPPDIVLIDESVAHLVGCIVVRDGRDRNYYQAREWSWSNHRYVDFDIEPYWDEADLDEIDEEWRWRRKSNAAREREGDLLLMHYLLPHVRLYRKLRMLEISERAYYYRLNAALDSLEREHSYRTEHARENVQS